MYNYKQKLAVVNNLFLNYTFDLSDLQYLKTTTLGDGIT